MMMLACVVVAAVGQQVFEPTAKDQGIRVERDYCAEFVALAPKVEEGERAWPVYVEAYRALGCPPEAIYEWTNDEGEKWEDVRAYVDSHKAGMELLRRAAAMERMGYPLSIEDDPVMRATQPCDQEKLWPAFKDSRERPHRVFELRFSYVIWMRGFDYRLWADAAVAVKENDGKRTAKDIEALFGVARHACEFPCHEGDMQSWASSHVAFVIISDLLKAKPDLVSSEDLGRMIGWAESAPMEGRPRPRMDFVRSEVLDVLQRMYSDDGQGDGRFKGWGVREIDRMAASDGEYERRMAGNPGGAAEFFSSKAGRREALMEFDRVMASEEWRLPLWEMDHWPGIDSKELSPERWTKRYLAVSFVLPDLERLATLSERLLQKRDAVRVGLALELMRREKGAFPERLEELVPRYLGEVGKDRFTGEALKYKVVDGRAVVYSCGPDLDDDGGRRVEEAGDVKKWVPPRAKERDGVVDGDWVLVEVGVGGGRGSE